jgi:6,7-dimethyl-8-ribityllumazine synthase
VAKTAPEGTARAAGLRVAIVRSAFNAGIVDGLAKGAWAALVEAGADQSGITEIVAPGAFELPLACLAAARSGHFDAVVALGAVIRGDTDHYEHVAREAASGILRAGLDTGVPVSFGVLTVQHEEQARARSVPGPDNKGAEAANAAVAMVALLRAMRSPGS